MKYFVFLLLIASIVLAGCATATPRPPKPEAQSEHVVLWQNGAWVQIPQAEFDKIQAEKAKKAQDILDKAAIVEKATIDLLFAKPSDFLGKQATINVEIKAEFKKFAGGKYRTMIPMGDKMLILLAYDADYTFTAKNIAKDKEKYGLDFMSMTKVQIDATPTINITNLQGFVKTEGKTSTVDFKTKETKEYKSVTIQLVRIN
ncbi:MAG: hypothetical protein K8S87_04040 [Planctomycetes bacterium]|nr:hypothetical protein [Planctomycetota bacterium]